MTWDDSRCQARCADWPAVLGNDIDSPELHPSAELQWPSRSNDFATANAVHVRRIDVHADDRVSLFAGECSADRTECFREDTGHSPVKETEGLMGARLNLKLGANEIVADLRNVDAKHVIRAPLACIV